MVLETGHKTRQRVTHGTPGHRGSYCRLGVFSHRDGRLAPPYCLGHCLGLSLERVTQRFRTEANVRKLVCVHTVLELGE